MASIPRKKARIKKSKIPPRDTLTEQQRKEIEEAFDILDTDGSGGSNASLKSSCSVIGDHLFVCVVLSYTKFLLIFMSHNSTC